MYKGKPTIHALHTWWVRRKRPKEITMYTSDWHAIQEDKKKQFDLPDICDELLSGDITIFLI